MVGMSDTHHNRVARGTPVSSVGRRGGRSSLRAIACMRLHRKARYRGQRKIFFGADRGCFIRCQNLKCQPHSIIEQNRVGTVANSPG